MISDTAPTNINNNLNNKKVQLLKGLNMKIETSSPLHLGVYSKTLDASIKEEITAKPRRIPRLHQI